MAANLPVAVRRPPDLTTDRARAVLDRARAIPPGHVAAYSDLDPAAPRFAGTLLSAATDPRSRGTGSCAPTARSRRASARPRCSSAEGVPLTGDPRRVDVRLARWWGDVDPA